MPESVSDLLRAYIEGSDAAAFGQLVRRRIDFVYGCALRQANGDRHRASDITQEVFIALARKAASLKRHPSLLGWLCTTTRFIAIDAIRSEQARRAREQEASAMQLTDDHAPADWNRLQPVLDAALGELPPRDREAVLARYFDRQSFIQIARDFGLSENAAQKRVDRALDKLREALARRQVTSTSAALSLVLASQPGIAAPAALISSVTQSALMAGATAASAGSSGLWFLLMKNYAAGLAGLAATAGIGTAVLGLRAADEAERQQVVARQVTATLTRELSEQEQRVQTATDRVQRAEQTNAEWLREAERLRSRSTTSAPAEELITAELVHRRWDRMRQLVENGDPAEALRELVWLYDIGMPRVRGGGKDTSMLGFFGQLGERYEPALDLLRERRDGMREAARASTAGFEVLREYTALNGVLKEDAENVAFLESLPAGDRRRSTVASACFDYLMQHRRYQEAAEGMQVSTIRMAFQAVTRRGIPASTPDPERARAKVRDLVVKQAATIIEMLAGSGDLTNARAHATEVLAFDSSRATHAKLLEHATRAGHPEVVPPLSP